MIPADPNRFNPFQPPNGKQILYSRKKADWAQAMTRNRILCWLTYSILVMIVGFFLFHPDLFDLDSFFGFTGGGLTLAYMSYIGNIKGVSDFHTSGNRISYKVWLVDVNQVNTSQAFPTPNVNREVGTIPMKNGEFMHYFEAIDGTVKDYSTGEKSEYTTNITNGFDFVMGGDGEKLYDFIEEYAGGKFIVIYQNIYTRGYSIQGNLMKPMILQGPGRKRDNEATVVTFSFQNKDFQQPLKYVGAIINTTPQIVAAGSTTLAIITGKSQYQLSDHTSQVTITGISGVTSDMYGKTIEVLGSGGTYPPNILDNNSFILIDGDEWIGDEGYRVSFYILDSNTLVEIPGTRIDGGFDFNSLFTGIPIRFSENPMGIKNDAVSDDCMFRCIVKVGDTYHLFQENSGGTPYWRIEKRTSFDGLRFTAKSAALLSGGGSGEYDENGQADPTVIYDGPGDWKMWFDALSLAGTWSLGYATSSDGETWSNQGEVLSKSTNPADWDGNNVHHPVVIKHNGIYYMFYSGSKSGNPNGAVADIGLATSPDGINWTKHSSNPILSRGTSEEFDYYYLRPSAPVLIDNLWYMWYWGFDGTDANTYHAMGLATSPDLINWTKRGKVLGSSSGNPDEDSICASQAVLISGSRARDKIVKLYYTSYPESWLNFANVALPYSGTKLSKFSRSHSDKFGNDHQDDISIRGANYIYLFRVTVSSTTTISHIKLFIGATSKPGLDYKMKCAVYDNNGDTPNNLVIESEERDWTSLLRNEWNAIALNTPTEFTTGDYWIAIWSDASFYSPLAAGGSNNFGNLSQAYGTWPDPISATTNQGYNQVGVFLANLRTNVYEIALVSEPTTVYFNTVAGNKKTSIANVNSEYDWYWESGKLFVYAEEHPDIRYQLTYE